MAYNKPFFQTQNKDTGWGLIFRLNKILDKLELRVEAKDYEGWNILMDRIFVNITYRNPEEKVFDANGNVIDIKISEDDILIFSRFQKKIKEIKENLSKFKKEQKGNEIIKYYNQLYNIYFQKDIWVRKKMYQNKLYLTHEEHDPSKAIYGG